MLDLRIFKGSFIQRFHPTKVFSLNTYIVLVIGKIIVLFILMPLLEISLLLFISEKIGAINTIAIIVLTGIIGGFLAKREGIKTLRTLRYRGGNNKPIPKEIADGILILIGGVFLLTPGIITDIIGFIFLIPFTRPIARKFLRAYIDKKSGKNILYYESKIK